MDRERVRWRCRRGMRELDVLLMAFFEAHYDALSQDHKRLFRGLLELSDPALQAYLIAGDDSDEPALDELLRRIRTSLHP